MLPRCDFAVILTTPWAIWWGSTLIHEGTYQTLLSNFPFSQLFLEDLS